MGVELPLHVVVTILECCVTFSGVKLSIRSFVLFIIIIIIIIIIYRCEDPFFLTRDALSLEILVGVCL